MDEKWNSFENHKLMVPAPCHLVMKSGYKGWVYGFVALGHRVPDWRFQSQGWAGASLLLFSRTPQPRPCLTSVLASCLTCTDEGGLCGSQMTTLCLDCSANEVEQLHMQMMLNPHPTPSHQARHICKLILSSFLQFVAVYCTLNGGHFSKLSIHTVQC